MKGSCLCGSVQFDVTGVKKLYQCHCSLCRKQGGSASSTGAVVPLENVQWIKGKENIRSWVKETGFRSDFCATCGSLVPNPLRGLNYYWVPAGTLEDGAFEIVANIYLDSKASWGVVAPTGERFATAPEIEALVSMVMENGHE